MRVVKSSTCASASAGESTTSLLGYLFTCNRPKHREATYLCSNLLLDIMLLPLVHLMKPCDASCQQFTLAMDAIPARIRTRSSGFVCMIDVQVVGSDYPFRPPDYR